MDDRSLAELRDAEAVLEGEPAAARIAGILGTVASPAISRVGGMVPAPARRWLQSSLEAALASVLPTLASALPEPGSEGVWAALRGRWGTTAATVLVGAGGGAAGLPGTLAELPVATGLLLRAIAAEAVAQGEDIASDEGKLECLKVFALGGTEPGNAAASEGAYYAARIALTQAVGQVAGKSLGDLFPAMVAAAASRLGAPLGAKLAAGTVPIAGAVLGAAVNVAFARHYTQRARAHFTVRRLEREFGEAEVKAAYAGIVAVRTGSGRPLSPAKI